jgi:hypothetical protein
MFAVERRRGPTLFGCGAILLVTLLLVFVIVGWFRNWYNVAGRDDAQQVEFGVQINKEEVGRDFGKLRDETQRLTESVQVAAEMSTLEGVAVSSSATQLVVRVGERDIPVAVDNVTQYYTGEQQSDLQSIRPGEQVRVTYQETDGQKRASRVTLLAPGQPVTPQPAAPEQPVTPQQPAPAVN